MDIRTRGIHKRYGSFHALRGIDLDVASGELLALLGPSGSGKTTLLRAIAGLEPLDAGTIHFGDVDATTLTVQDRKVGFVFQQYALFKHMTVFDNVAFGLTVRSAADRPAKSEIAKRVGDLLELVQLGGLEKRYPAQLSGGQKQRVALARALAIEPSVLLLDEPFGALDAKVRKDLRRWLRKLHRDTGYTTIFVTHDQEEALELADRVVVMSRGVIEQVGTTDEVYDHPSTPFVFDFLGSPNVLPATIRDGNVVLDGASAALGRGDPGLAGAFDVYVRPTDFRIVLSDPAALEGTIVETQRTGVLIRLTVRLASSVSIEVEVPNLNEAADSGTKIWKSGDSIRLRPVRFSVFPNGTATHGSNAPIDPATPGLGTSHTVVDHRSRARG